MGIILSRFRKKKNAEELLEDIEKEIEDIESNKQYAVQREKYIVWRLILYSVLLYIISAFLFYVYFFPASLRDQIFYLIPLLTFPLIIFFVKRCITWVYKRKISKNKSRLNQLKSRKKQVLDDVMNTETYKVAKQILDKYAPEQVKKPTSPAQNMIGYTPPGSGKPGISSVALVTSSGGQHPSTVRINTPLGASNSNRPLSPSTNVYPQRRLVRPVVPRERTYIDRIIDAIVGDGPQNRYALICKNCASHNGMALQDEFENLAFRCVYCGFPNPSRIQRRPLSLDYKPTQSDSSSSIKELSELTQSNGSTQLLEDNEQSSGVEITEVTDTSTDKIEGIKHRNITNHGEISDISTIDSDTEIEAELQDAVKKDIEKEEEIAHLETTVEDTKKTN